MKPVTTVLALLAITGCKDKPNPDQPPATATTKAATAQVKRSAGADPRLVLALYAPLDATSFDVPNTRIDDEDQPQTLAEYQAELAEYGEAALSSEALADGWAVQLADGDLETTRVQRKLGARTLTCETDGQDQAAHDVGRASCLAMTVAGDHLVVPFGKPTEDGAGLGFGDLALSLELATEDTPTSPEIALEHTGWRKTGKLLERETLAGGFAAVIEGHSADRAENAKLYRAVVRTQLGGLDLECTPWGSAKTAEIAAQVLAACRDLRAY